MQLTSHTDYSLRLLIYLSTLEKSDNPLGTIKDAAQRFDISIDHLSKVAQTLAKLDYVKTQRGRGGGLRLNKPAQDINIGELVCHTENLNILECFSDSPKCVLTPICKLRSVINEAKIGFIEVLNQYTLEDVIDNQQAIAEVLEISIRE